MERYYGPVQADPKRIHTSLVGCLRNQRNSKKKDEGLVSSTSNDNYIETVNTQDKATN